MNTKILAQGTKFDSGTTGLDNPALVVILLRLFTRTLSIRTLYTFLCLFAVLARCIRFFVPIRCRVGLSSEADHGVSATTFFVNSHNCTCKLLSNYSFCSDIPSGSGVILAYGGECAAAALVRDTVLDRLRAPARALHALLRHRGTRARALQRGGKRQRRGGKGERKWGRPRGFTEAGVADQSKTSERQRGKRQSIGGCTCTLLQRPWRTATFTRPDWKWSRRHYGVRGVLYGLAPLHRPALLPQHSDRHSVAHRHSAQYPSFDSPHSAPITETHYWNWINFQ